MFFFLISYHLISIIVGKTMSSQPPWLGMDTVQPIYRDDWGTVYGIVNDPHLVFITIFITINHC